MLHRVKEVWELLREIAAVIRELLSDQPPNVS